MKESVKSKVTGNAKGKLEKILWACLIIMFIISFLGMFIGKYMEGPAYYKICTEMTVFSIIIITFERFYFGKEMGRDMPQVFNLGYWLIVAWAAILLIQYFGVSILPFLMENEYRVFWVVVPTLSLLWETRYIFGDNLDWDPSDKHGWKEGRMNYSQKSNKKNMKKKAGK